MCPQHGFARNNNETPTQPSTRIFRTAVGRLNDDFNDNEISNSQNPNLSESGRDDPVIGGY
jgi:hypothetical protein